MKETNKYIKVLVVAGAKKEKFQKTKENYLSISVKEPAQRNQANNRVRELIALHFKRPINCVRIISGHHSPGKLISIDFI